MEPNVCALIDETSSSSCSLFSSSSSSSSSPSPPSTKITIRKTITNKRKTMLTVNGYDFQMKNYNKTKTIKFWRCANRDCGVLLHTNLNDEFLRFSGNMFDHSHLPNPAALEVRTLRERMRQRAERELLPLQEIAEQEVRKGLLSGEALAVLPNILNLGHNLVHNRRQVMPPLPKTDTFNIPDAYKKDLNGNRLLLHDSHDPQFQIGQSLCTQPEGRILVWSSDMQLKLLFDSEKLYMDGTFSTTPQNFEQFTEKNIQKGCFFRFCQAIYRKVQSNSLSTAYLEDIRMRSVIRQLMALALVPHEHVSLLFDHLLEGLDEHEREQLDGIFKYFETQWLRQTNMWIVFSISDRTNNYSEGM
ncbi:unnamed protein product [Rotaria socialis]